MHERYSSDNAMSSSDQESNVIIMDSQGLLKLSNCQKFGLNPDMTKPAGV